MKKNILFVASGNIESDLAVIDAASRTAQGVLRASIASYPTQILARALKDIDALIVNVDEDSRALAIIGAFGGSEAAPPVIAWTSAPMARVAYCHGASVCVNKPFSAGISRPSSAIFAHTRIRWPSNILVRRFRSLRRSLLFA